MFARMYIVWASNSGKVFFEVLDFCIIIAKYYIHNKRLLEDNNIDFFNVLYDLKSTLTLELNISIKIILNITLANFYLYMNNYSPADHIP